MRVPVQQTPNPMVLPMAAHEGAWSAPLTGIDSEGLGSRLMLEEEEGEGEEMGGTAGRRRVEMAAVARAWRAVKAQEEMASQAWDKAATAEEGLEEAELRSVLESLGREAGQTPQEAIDFASAIPGKMLPAILEEVLERDEPSAAAESTSEPTSQVVAGTEVSTATESHREAER